MRDNSDGKPETTGLLFALGIGSIIGVLTIVIVIACLYATYLLVVITFDEGDPGHDGGRDATGGTHGLSEGDLGDDVWGGTSGRAPDAGD